MRKLMLTAAAATFTAAFAAPTAHAGPMEDSLVRDANRVKSAASSLRGEFQIHFRHTPVFSRLVGDTVSISKKADAIQGLAYQVHSRTGLLRLDSELRGLSQLVQNLGGLIDRMPGSGGRPGLSTHRARGLVAQLKSTTQSLQNTARAMEARFRGPGSGPQVRDHRTPAGSPEVRDHRTPAGSPEVRDHRSPSGAPEVRDHRRSGAPGSEAERAKPLPREGDPRR